MNDERTVGDDAHELRAQIKTVAAATMGVRVDLATGRLEYRGGDAAYSEVLANLTLAYRHLEDASMRLGKAIQAADGGVSVYDKNVVGAPETP